MRITSRNSGGGGIDINITLHNFLAGSVPRALGIGTSICISCLTAFVADRQSKLLSNELCVTWPLDTDDIMLPAEANPSLKDDGRDHKKVLLPADENLDDIYKEVLKIQPGSPDEGAHSLSVFRINDCNSI